MKKIILIAFLFVSVFANANDTTVVNLQVGANFKSATIFAKDKITGFDVPATFTNVTVQNINPEIAKIEPNTTNQRSIRATPVSEGSGTATITCNVSYTDPGDGQTKNESKTIVISYTVIAAAHGVKLSLVFN